MQRLLCVLFVLVFFNPQGSAQDQQAQDVPVRTLIRAFADARNTHDGQAVAVLYSEDGEYISSMGTFASGQAALSKVWSSVSGHVDRTISRIDFPGENIAVVHVDVQHGPQIGLHHEVFILVREWQTWRIRIHQTTD